MKQPKKELRMLIPFDQINENKRVYVHEHTEIKPTILAFLDSVRGDLPLGESFAQLNLVKKKAGVYIKEIKYFRNSDTGDLIENAIKAQERLRRGGTIVPAGYGRLVATDKAGHMGVKEIHEFKLTGAFITEDPAFKIISKIDLKDLAQKRAESIYQFMEGGLELKIHQPKALVLKEIKKGILDDLKYVVNEQYKNDHLNIN